MSTRLSAMRKKLKKEVGKIPEIPSSAFAIASSQSTTIPELQKDLEYLKRRYTRRNNPDLLAADRAFKRKIDAEKIARCNHPHPYNYDEWVLWTGNQYIKSYYTVKRADGSIVEYARPNAGMLFGYHGEIIPEMEKNVMVKLADTFPL